MTLTPSIKISIILRILFILFFGQSAVAIADIAPSERKIVSEAVGEIILIHVANARYDFSDTNPFGNEKAFVAFREIYKDRIAGLAVENRVDYFWAIMWYLRPEGGNLTEFEEIVARDCPDEFVEKLKRYVSIEEKSKKYPKRLLLSKVILYDLVVLRDYYPQRKYK